MYYVVKMQSCSNAKTHDAYSNHSASNGQATSINECMSFGKRCNFYA
jgi:hypothetical protein